MNYFNQEPFDIRCEWGLPGVEQIATSDVIIIVDVLSFSTSVAVAVSRGVTVFPYRWNDDSAQVYARQHSAELATSRSHVPGQYSLSPSSLIKAPEGLRLVLPSPNGSNLSFAAISQNATVFAGCLRNASAVAKHAQAAGKRITVVPAGERWSDGSLRPAIEDLIGAGAIIKQLRGTLSPESSVALVAFENAVVDLQECLLNCSSGRELKERGFVDDVALAAELDVSQVVPVLIENAFIR